MMGENICGRMCAWGLRRLQLLFSSSLRCSSDLTLPAVVKSPDRAKSRSDDIVVVASLKTAMSERGRVGRGLELRVEGHRFKI